MEFMVLGMLCKALGHLASALSLDSFLPVSHHMCLTSVVLDFFWLLGCAKMISTGFIPFHMLSSGLDDHLHCTPSPNDLLTDDDDEEGGGRKK